jgi:hypothetical protein
VIIITHRFWKTSAESESSSWNAPGGMKFKISCNLICKGSACCCVENLDRSREKNKGVSAFIQGEGMAA